MSKDTIYIEVTSINMFLYFYTPQSINWEKCEIIQAENTLNIKMHPPFASMTFSIPLPLFSTSFPFMCINKAAERHFSFWPGSWDFGLSSIHVLLAILLPVSMFSNSSSHSFVTLRTSSSGLGHENTRPSAATRHNIETPNTWTISCQRAASASRTTGLLVSTCHCLAVDLHIFHSFWLDGPGVVNQTKETWLLSLERPELLTNCFLFALHSVGRG